MPKLYVLSGPDLGRTFEVEAGAKLGRAAHCAVHLRDVSVSREHAQLVQDEGQWRVVDTGSRNGVSVGGSKVASAALDDGSEFLVGEVLLRFRGDVLAATPVERETVSAKASRAELARDEIVLEEDPLEGIPVSAPAAGGPASPVSAPPPRVASEFERTVLAVPRPEAAIQRGRGILQYRKIPERSGIFAADLSQQPLWIRFGAGLIAIALFAAIFLFAFKGTSFLKSQAAGGGAVVEDDLER